MKPYQDITDPALAKALAHPLRTRILAALEGRTASPSELAGELDTAVGRPRITNDAWGTLPEIVKHASIAAAVDQVGAYVAAAAAEGGFDAADAHITRNPVTVVLMLFRSPSKVPGLMG